MSDFETMLNSVTPDQLAADPIMRRAFIVAMLASDFYLPTATGAEDQAQGGGIELMTLPVNTIPHVVIFSSEARLKAFCANGTRFARAAGQAIFPAIQSQCAIMNPGPSGLVLTPDDMAEMLGGETTQPPCGAPGHVHGSDCSH